MLVAVDRLQVVGDRRGQRAGIGRVPSFGQPPGQHTRHRGRDLGKDVVLLDQRADLPDDAHQLGLVHTVNENIRLTKRQ